MAALLLVGCLAGCGEKPAEPAASPEAAAPETEVIAEEATAEEMHTIKDAADRDVTLKLDPQRIVVTFNLEEYFAVAGAEGVDKLVGFSHAYWEGRRQDAWDTFTAAFPELKDQDDVGYNYSISVEKIISLNPDLVIMSAPVNSEFIEPHLPKLEELGIPVLFVNYHKQTIETHCKSTMAIGEALGQTERAQEICDFYTEQMNLISD